MLQSVNYVNIGVHLKLRLHFKNALRGLHAKFSHRKVEVYTLECSDFEFFRENGEEQCRYECYIKTYVFRIGVFPFLEPFCADLASKLEKRGLKCK
jgi:hypothetical protein